MDLCGSVKIAMKSCIYSFDVLPTHRRRPPREFARISLSLSLSVPLYHPSFVRLLCTVIDGWFLAGAYASARTRTQTHARIALHTHINIAVYCISIVSQCQRFPSFYLSRSMSYWNFAIPYASSAFVANALANVCAHMCVLCVFMYERTSGHWCNKREQR